MGARAQGNRESRRAPRRVFNYAIGVLLHGEYGIEQALQLSEGGMLFASHRAVPLHSYVVLSLILPGGICVVTRGQVIYDRPGTAGATNFGIKFMTLAIQHRRQIRNYVSAKTQEESELESEESGGAKGAPHLSRRSA